MAIYIREKCQTAINEPLPSGRTKGEVNPNFQQKIENGREMQEDYNNPTRTESD